MKILNTTELPDPSTVEVAPHRYLWNDPHELDRWIAAGKRGPGSLKAWIELLPYKAGEVIYIQHEDNYVKAYISYVSCRSDCWGDRKERYHVHKLNKDGKRFSRRVTIAHPGYVQRGYYRAGLAPDIPKGAI